MREKILFTKWKPVKNTWAWNPKRQIHYKRLLWYILYLRVTKSDPLLIHLPKPLDSNWKLLGLTLVMVGGKSPCLGTKTNKLVDRSLHEKPSPSNLTGLLLSPDANLTRLGQTSMRSIEIWPNFDEICRDLHCWSWDLHRYSLSISTWNK